MSNAPKTNERLKWLWLFGAWAIVLVLIDPRGEFPLNDDWSYARVVKTLHDTGELAHPVAWASMTLIAQVLWGWLVSSLFGFSFFVLRMGALVPAAAGIVGIYVLLRQARVAKEAAFVAAAVTAFSPWYLQLSLSFMTDVPFLAASIWSAIFFLRRLEDGTLTDFWLGVGFSLIATMIRQHGIFLPAAWGVALLWRNRNQLQMRLHWAVVPLAVHGAYLSFHSRFLGPVMGTHSTALELHNWGMLAATQGWGAVVTEIFSRAAAVWVYSGVLALPVWLYGLFGRRMRPSWTLVALGILAILVPLVGRPYVPNAFNLVYDLGIGPPTLRDVYLLGLPHLPHAPRGIWIGFTTVGLFGGAILLTRWIKFVRDLLTGHTDNPAITFLTVFSLGGLALFPLTPFLDRHMLLFLPMLYFLGAPQHTEQPAPNGVGRTVALAIVLTTALFATAGVHDYFAWNRARWAALEWLESNGVKPDQVDGGFEYNGWNTFDTKYRPEPDKSWWWVKDDEYMGTFGPVSGYSTIHQTAYRGWLPPGNRAIYVLRRTAKNDNK